MFKGSCIKLKIILLYTALKINVINVNLFFKLQYKYT